MTFFVNIPRSLSAISDIIKNYLKNSIGALYSKLYAPNWASKMKIFCGTPASDCTGGITVLNGGWSASPKTHHSSLEAFNCYVKYLLRQGFIRCGSRELINPISGCIRVLDKKTHFGCKLRKGKNSEKTKKRFVPRQGGGAIV